MGDLVPMPRNGMTHFTSKNQIFIFLFLNSRYVFRFSILPPERWELFLGWKHLIERIGFVQIPVLHDVGYISGVSDVIQRIAVQDH